MKKQGWALFIVLMSLASITNLAYAAGSWGGSNGGSSHRSSSSSDESSGGEVSPFYLGVGVGQFFYHVPSGFHVDSPVVFQINAGYSFTPNIALEYCYTEPLANGNNYNWSVPSAGLAGNFEERTHSLYGVFRTSGNIFFKMKVGATYEHYQITSTTTGVSDSEARDAVTNSSNGVYPSIGVGLGLHSKQALFEAEYVYTDEKSDNSTTAMMLGMKLLF